MPLHKSFSEQNRVPNKRNGQWQRSKSHPTVAQQLGPGPSIPVSAKSKTKLQQFQFQQPSESTTDNPKKGKGLTKNSPIVLDGSSDKENQHSFEQEGQPSLETSKPSNNTLTPAGRFPWQEDFKEAANQKDDEETPPTERLLWHNDRDTIASAISPILPRKGRKRARSSSPMSSPNTPAVNIKKLAQALKSPYADPALDLWDRFSSVGLDSAKGLGASNPALAHLMVSSSPRPSKDGTASQSESSLRRAISCGSNWPKRRRVDRSETQSPTSQRGLQRGNSKSSMVSALLQTVTGEINKSQEVQLRDRLMRSPSPQKRQSPRKAVTQDSRGSPSKVAANSTSNLDAAVAVEKDSSDYGDDDFDDDTLMELDASLVPIISQQTPAVAAPNPAPTLPHNNIPQKVDEDEFGDLDDDVFAEAEDLMAEIVSMPTSQIKDPTLPQKQDLGQNVHPGGGTDGSQDAYGDDFGGDFDFEAAELAATRSLSQTATSLSHPNHKPRVIQRYLVTNALLSCYTNDNGCEYPEKILVVQAERTNSIKTIHLRGDWIDTPASTNSYVHIIGEFESAGHCVIDNSRNILILHPDQLISATVIADSFSCMRRAVLQDRVKATSDPSGPLVYGTLLHEIFQEALMANNWDSSFLVSVIDKAMKKHIEDLYTIKVGFNDAREHLLSKMTELRHWAADFVSSWPKPNAVVQGRNGEKATMCVSKLLDVEEHVWSPMYGLKGNIDATVQVTLKQGGDTRTLTVPFEVKTGKNVNTNHEAQTVLYNLLLSDRYDIEIMYGILYYMETSLTKRIPAMRNELRHMILQRNRLACYIRERSVELPPMKKSRNDCGKCYAQTSCFIYHKLADDGDGETSGMRDKFDAVVKHLSPKHKEFFLKWEDLLTKEEKESQKLRRELWTMVSTEREKLGRCFADVVIEEGSASEDVNTPKINRFHYTFIKQNPASGFSFLDSQLAVGEPIVVSDEQGHFALALGFVTAVRKQRISVAVDRRLHNARIRQAGFNEVDNQVFASIMEVAPEGAKPEQSQGRIKEAPIRYRLDKDEFSNGMALVRNNLVQVMANGPFGSQEIRQLVVDLVPPQFKSVSTQYSIADQESLNIDQRKAIEKVMSAKDYALVLGMPGTGKTTTIAHIIRALVQQKKSVLLTSYTHTAVDNILLKLKKDNINILRLGAPAKVHPEVQEFAVLAGQPMDTFEEIRSAWHDTPVVATTCLGISHPVFNERTFDYCIVDEASQITLPICLGPIRMARTFVLVGDHNQLPPLVQNEEARVGGLDVSLFKLLSDTYPDSVVNLEHQYRMSEDIMTLSNTLIYKGRLKCGTEDLRFRTLDVPNMDALRRHHYDAESFLTSNRSSQKSFCVGTDCWMRDLLAPETRAAFVNTDAILESREEAKGNRIVNPCEARIVVQLVEALQTIGVPANEIGVMTHYRSQLSLLKHGLRGNNIEMHTADRFQGRDKEVIILSLVRSNEACNIGDLLKDWRRINVAFTRAKTKLLVVGSRSTLKGSGSEEMLARFISLMEERAWIHDLPSDALDSHFFDDTATQVTASMAVTQAMSGTGKKRMIGSSLGKSPTKGSQHRCGGKENQPPGPKRAKIGERAILKGKPVLRDILNDMMDGMY